MKNTYKNTITQKTFASLVTLILFLMPSFATGQGPIIPGSVLSLQECIDIALKNHPDIKGAFHTVRIGESRIGQAQSDYYPQIESQSSYNRSGSSYSGRPDTSPSNQYSSSINLRQNIYDFGRRSVRNQIAGLNRDSFQEDLQEISAIVILRVKQAYYSVLQAIENTAVANKSVDQFQTHLELANAFFEVGLKPKFDVTKAEVDLSNAKLDLIRAENTLRITKATLNNAMGMPGAPGYHLENNLFPEEIDLSLESSLNRAYENRHDLKSILLRQESAQKNLNLNRSGHYPTVTGNASYGYGGSEFPLGDGWSFGGYLNIPIFNGFLTQSQILEAKENIAVITAHVESMKQNIRLEVEQAISNLREAINRIETTDIIVRQAEENSELAEGRYRSGVGTPIEVTDALLALNQAQISRIAALTDFKIRQATLEKAIGVK